MSCRRRPSRGRSAMFDRRSGLARGLQSGAALHLLSKGQMDMSSWRASGHSPRRFRAALVSSLVAAAVVVTSGCMCGASAVPTHEQGKGAVVEADGTVVYEHTTIGDSVKFDIPVRDTADVSETLMSARITGADADAFDVHATFPIDMPAGKTVHVEVTFHPTKTGEATAELVIETQAMGPSPIELTGVGIEPRAN
jgi:hypothetical protein